MLIKGNVLRCDYGAATGALNHLALVICIKAKKDTSDTPLCLLSLRTLFGDPTMNYCGTTTNVEMATVGFP